MFFTSIAREPNLVWLGTNAALVNSIIDYTRSVLFVDGVWSLVSRLARCGVEQKSKRERERENEKQRFKTEIFFFPKRRPVSFPGIVYFGFYMQRRVRNVCSELFLPRSRDRARLYATNQRCVVPRDISIRRAKNFLGATTASSGVGSGTCVWQRLEYTTRIEFARTNLSLTCGRVYGTEKERKKGTQPDNNVQFVVYTR